MAQYMLRNTPEVEEEPWPEAQRTSSGEGTVLTTVPVVPGSLSLLECFPGAKYATLRRLQRAQSRERREEYYRATRFSHALLFAAYKKHVRAYFERQQLFADKRLWPGFLDRVMSYLVPRRHITVIIEGLGWKTVTFKVPLYRNLGKLTRDDSRLFAFDRVCCVYEDTKNELFCPFETVAQHICRTTPMDMSSLTFRRVDKDPRAMDQCGLGNACMYHP